MKRALSFFEGVVKLLFCLTIYRMFLPRIPVLAQSSSLPHFPRNVVCSYDAKGGLVCGEAQVGGGSGGDCSGSD